MKNHFEPLTNNLVSISAGVEAFRKIVVDIFIFFVVIVIIVAVIRNSRSKQLLMYPFKVPKALTDQGITGEILTSWMLDRIHIIKNSGSNYYQSNSVELPSWDNQIDEFKKGTAGDTYSAISGVFKFLFGENQQNANGEITVISKDSLRMTFRINGQNEVISIAGNNADTLVNKAAEFVMEKSEPYYLAYWYLKNGQKEKCLKLVQRMLNDDDSGNDGLALHIRGSSFISQQDMKSNNEAIKTLREALNKIKAPWLTYNNLGVAYYYRGDSVKSALMYQLSIKANPKTFGGYLNYGNLLYSIYQHDTRKIKQLDSAIQLYCKSIEYNKNDVREYMAIFPALYSRNKVDLANQYFEKAQEMDKENYLIYYQMGQVQIGHKDYAEALTNFKLAQEFCNTKSGKEKIQDIINALKKALEPAVKKVKHS